MTLREIISTSGACVDYPKELGKLEVINANDISLKELLVYFNSAEFKRDILSIQKYIRKIMKKYPYYKIKNFFLLFHTDLDKTIKKPTKLSSDVYKF